MDDVDEWYTLDEHNDLNVYTDMDGNMKVSVYPVVNGETETSVWKQLWPIQNCPDKENELSDCLDKVWKALQCYREDSIPEGDEMYDNEWAELAYAIAKIAQELKLPTTERTYNA